MKNEGVGDEEHPRSPAGEFAEGRTERRPLTWRRLLLLNVGILTGIVASAFVVPRSTPVWVWALVSGAALLGLNWAFLANRRPAAQRGSPRHRKALAIILLGLALLLADILFGHVHI